MISSHLAVGRSASRSITDPCALVMFFLAWGFMISLASVAFRDGSVARALHGTDYNGNVCGQSASRRSNFTPPSDWLSRGSIWYPIQFSSGSFHVEEAMQLGVCVATCPDPTTTPILPTYGGAYSNTIPSEYPVLFSSTPRFGRCVPNIATYACSSLACIQSRASASLATDMLNNIGVGDMFFGFVTQMSVGWGMICTLTIVCVILCFLWLVILRRMVRILVMASSLALVVLLVVIGCVALHQRGQTFDNGGDESGWYTCVAVMAFGSAAAFVCVFIYLFKDIVLSCSMIEEATRVITSAPCILFVPLVQSVVVVAIAVFFSFVAVNIYTSQSSSIAAVTVANQTSTVVSFAYENWRGVGQFYNLFMFLWTMGVAHACTTIIISLVAVQWFWSVPSGAEKQTPEDGIRWSVWTCFRYHLGTAIFGAFLIAVIQFLRFLLRLAENRLRQVMKRSDVVSVLVCIAECLLACFERIVRFLTKNAYVMTAMTGGPLIISAKRAFGLLVHDVKVLTVNIISDVMISIGKFSIVAFTTLMGYIWMSQHAAYDSVSSGGGGDGGDSSANAPASNFLVVLVVLALVAYFVASLFASVFHVCVDVILLSYCYDREINNGQDRPFYSPASLNEFIEASQERHPLDDPTKSESTSLLGGGTK